MDQIFNFQLVQLDITIHVSKKNNLKKIQLKKIRVGFSTKTKTNIKTNMKSQNRPYNVIFLFIYYFLQGFYCQFGQI